jgi:hypothetical protein
MRNGHVTGSMCSACATGTFCTTTIVVVVQNVVQVPLLPFGHVTPKGLPWVRACTTGSWGFPPFFLVFSDMLCSNPRPRSHWYF